jgi:hypothetical protein
MRTKALFASLATSLLTLICSPFASAASISIAPGVGPGGYIPLELFGTPAIAGMGDESVVNFNVPSFSFGGQTYTTLGVASNGYAIVGGGSDVQALNVALPNPAAPRNMLAPFWTDLNPALAGAVRINSLTDGVDTWIVIDWDEVAHASNASELNSFEIWIGINGDGNPGEDITFAYGNMGSLHRPYTVGAQDATGTIGATYYFNGAGTPVFNMAELRVTAEGLTRPDGVVPLPGSLALAGLGLAFLIAARRRG